MTLVFAFQIAPRSVPVQPFRDGGTRSPSSVTVPCACAATPCSPPSPTNFSSCMLFQRRRCRSTWILCLFRKDDGSQKKKQHGDSCRRTQIFRLPLFYHTSWGPRCRSNRIFFGSTIDHETELREGPGGCDRHSRSGSNCLLGNLRFQELILAAAETVTGHSRQAGLADHQNGHLDEVGPARQHGQFVCGPSSRRTRTNLIARACKSCRT